MKVKRKPLIYDAVQWFEPGDHPAVHYNQEDSWVVWTLEGEMKVTKGDWIMTGVKGEHWPIKSDVFEQSYEVLPREENFIDAEFTVVESVISIGD